MSRFQPGQVWSYRTRPGEEGSRLTVVKVEPHEKLGTIVHVRVEGVSQKMLTVPGGVCTVIRHMPFAEEAVQQSVVELLDDDGPVDASFEEGYGIWKEAFDKGKAGVFTITVAETITFCEGVARKAVAASLTERWEFFASQGPEYSLPTRSCFIEEALPGLNGSLHVALYAREHFADLVDFNLYQNYSSSVQQVLIQTGAIDYEWFSPDTVEEGVSSFLEFLEDFRPKQGPGDIRKILRGLRLPREARWVLDLDFEEWDASIEEGNLDITAATRQGYLTMFVAEGLG